MLTEFRKTKDGNIEITETETRRIIKTKEQLEAQVHELEKQKVGLQEIIDQIKTALTELDKE